MVKISFTMFLMLLLLNNLYCQVKTIPDSLVFSGVVINKASSLPIPDVTCRYGHQQGTISDEGGCFRIRTVRGDSVLFTCVGFKPYLIVISDTLLEAEYMVGVFMSPDTLELSEALVLKRWRGNQQQNWVNARNNMSGILHHAYSPIQTMDAGMNQKMMLEDYARSVEMRGHVDVGLGVGTQSIEAYRLLQRQKKQRNEHLWLNYGEIDLLKKLYYLEKKENKDN